MKIGVVFPQIEFGSDPVLIREYAQTAEELGYDYLLAYDHVLGANPGRPGGWRGPYTYQDTFHEIFVLFAYLAGITSRIEFVSGILILPQRQTVLVAKQAAEIDVLSGGRFRLGIGIGWNKVEYDGMGMAFHTRGQDSAEQVNLMRELWTKRLVTYENSDIKIDDAGIYPLPVQQPIPVWFGGGADVVLRRMAHLGDGWIVNFMPVERGRELVARLHEYLAAEGRDPASFGMDFRVSLAQQPKAEWRAYIEGWRDLGATHVAIETMRAGLTPAQHIEAIREFKAEVDT